MFRSDRHKLIGAVLGLAVGFTIMVLCFALPSVNSGAHDLEVGITGDPQVVHQIEQQVAKAAPGDFEFRHYADESAIRDDIKTRDLSGGIVAANGHAKVLVATAGGAAIAQSLRGMALGLGHATGQEVPVQDVVPYTSDDPQGGGISSAGLPLIFGGIIPALAFSMLFRRRMELRVAGAMLCSLVAGLILAGLLDFGYGTIDENFWAVAGGIALGLAAISLPAIGLQARFGAPGLAAMSATMILIGNPLSGLANSAAWLPSPWGAIGQLLPPGATGTVLRSNAFFDGHGAAAGLIVLTCWVAAGMFLCALATRRAHRSTAAELVPAMG